MTNVARTSGIYSIENSVTGKVYIGSAANLYERKASHMHRLRNGKHHSSKLQNSWDKHGETAFVFKTLIYCAKQDLLFYEQRFLDGFDAVATGYNICPTAGNQLGIKHSEKSRANMAAAAAKRRGIPLTPEHRAVLSLAHKGRKQSEEHIRKRADARRGKAQPRHAVEALAEKLRGRKRDPLASAKRLETMRRNEAEKVARGEPKRSPITEETKAKIAATLFGRKLTDEHKQKLKDAWKMKKMKMQADAKSVVYTSQQPT